jgi:hypothetical protein
MDILILMLLVAGVGITANLFYRKPIRWTNEPGPSAEEWPPHHGPGRT